MHYSTHIWNSFKFDRQRLYNFHERVPCIYASKWDGIAEEKKNVNVVIAIIVIIFAFIIMLWQLSFIIQNIISSKKKIKDEQKKNEKEARIFFCVRKESPAGQPCWKPKRNKNGMNTTVQNLCVYTLYTYTHYIHVFIIHKRWTLATTATTATTTNTNKWE